MGQSGTCHGDFSAVDAQFVHWAADTAIGRNGVGNTDRVDLEKRRTAFAGGTRFFTGLSSTSLKNGKKNGRAAFAARPRCCQAVLKFVKCHAVDVIIHKRWAGRQRQFLGILCHLFGFFAQCTIEKQHGGAAERTVADEYGFVLQSGGE